MSIVEDEMATLQSGDNKPKPVPVLKKKPLPKETDYGFIFSVIVLELIIIVLYAVTTDYNQGHPGDSYDNYKRTKDIETTEILEDYPPFVDVQGMMIVGFGFLMTFLRQYGFSALSFNFLLCGYGIQWAMLVWDHIGTGHIFHTPYNRVVFTTYSLVDANVAVAAILISLGAILGRVTPTQILWMSFLELIVYSFNGYIFYHILNAVDPGGSITIHTFGAYWGLAVSWMLEPPKDESENKSMYQNDMFSMIGCLFLWLYWPSFNSFYCPNDYWQRDRAVLNTVLSLCGSVVSAFFISKIVREGRFEMMHIQNSTLAGGVVMGACASLYLQPAGAIGIGMVAGIISVLGYRYLQDILKNQLQLFDTCGVHNLHGMPGVLGCFASAIAIGSAAHNHVYDHDARIELIGQHGYQLAAGRQILGLLITWALSIPGGLVCGAIIKSRYFNQNETFFKDSEQFLAPEGDLEHIMRGTIRGKVMLEGINASEKLEQYDN